MITATIGKIFLEAYNKKYGTNYDAKSFFVEVYYPLFFDSNKYLFWANNSPFDQMKKAHKVETMSKADRMNLLQSFLSKVDSSKSPDASIALGYPASEEKGFATTSGQVTNLSISISKEDYYLSWFGAALGVGIQGGLSILFSEPEILLDEFEGWKLYRMALDKNDQLKDYKLNTWNGQWLAHRYDKINFYPDQPMAGFNPYETTKEGMGIATQTWTKILIGISRQFDYPKMMGYVYNIGNTNTTIGFIPFNLEHIRRPIELYQKLFGEIEGREAEELWGTREDGFKVCCQKGAIGIEAMRPKDLEQYMTADKGAKLPKYDEKQIISFHTYQIWLLAMLNNEELWEKSLEFAKVLQNFVLQDKTISPKRKNIVESILSTTSQDKFISSLKELLSNDDIGCINDIAKIVLSMPDSNFKLFLTLIGFHYAVIEKQKDLSINN